MGEVSNFQMNGFADPQWQKAINQMWNMEQYQPNQYTPEAGKSVPSSFGTPFFNFGNLSAMQQLKNESAERKRKANPVPEEKKDNAYFEKRRKNNDSARKSREERRKKDEQTKIDCDRLQMENFQLRSEIECLKMELYKLKTLFTNNPLTNQMAWNQGFPPPPQ